jgi:hypothetical protein
MGPACHCCHRDVTCVAFVLNRTPLRGSSRVTGLTEIEFRGKCEEGMAVQEASLLVGCGFSDCRNVCRGYDQEPGRILDR